VSATLEKFAEYCGPGALAAVLGISRYSAAHMLMDIQRSRGRWRVPYASSDDLEIALIERGVALEPWATDRAAAQPIGTIEQYRAVLDARFRSDCTATAERRARGDFDQKVARGTTTLERLVALQAIDDAAVVVEAYGAELVRQYMTVNEWLTRPGVWLIYAERVDTESVQHVIAARDGRVLAGDTRDAKVFGASPVMYATKLSKETPT
jgi:hypothetical protein